jgi:hypothetical protein
VEVVDPLLLKISIVGRNRFIAPTGWPAHIDVSLAPKRRNKEIAPYGPVKKGSGAVAELREACRDPAEKNQL